MIASIRGTIIYKNDQFLVIETGGIGYKVFATQATIAASGLNDHIFLHIHHITREDGAYLYGFERIEERDLFVQVISVSGIGPKLGMGMLSSLSAEAIQRAVMHEQDEVFSRLSGIGDKTAKKIVLLLKDKIEPLLGDAGLTEFPDSDEDVLQALVALGYSAMEAQKAVASIPQETGDDLEERLKIALKYFTA